MTGHELRVQRKHRPAPGVKYAPIRTESRSIGFRQTTLGNGHDFWGKVSPLSPLGRVQCREKGDCVTLRLRRRITVYLCPIEVPAKVRLRCTRPLRTHGKMKSACRIVSHLEPSYIGRTQTNERRTSPRHRNMIPPRGGHEVRRFMERGCRLSAFGCQQEFQCTEPSQEDTHIHTLVSWWPRLDVSRHCEQHFAA